MKLKKELVIYISRRRWLKRLLINFLPPKVCYSLYNQLDFYYDPRDMRGPSFHFAYDLEKGFHNYELESKKKLLSLIPKEGIFYDIGANIGMYSVYMALKKSNLTIYCFEPEPIAFDCLKSTFDSVKNDRVTLFNKAVGSCEEVRSIYKSSTNDGGHTLIKNRNADFVKDSDVSVINIDQLVQDKRIKPPHAIKIDVEGFELEVLKGMEKTIIESKPHMLIECNNNDLMEKKGIWTFLSNLSKEGLVVSLPDDQANFPIDQLSSLAKNALKKNNDLSNYIFSFR